VDRAGNVSADSGLGADPGAQISYYEPATRHNIPAAFWQYLNQTGPVDVNGKTVTAPINTPWYYASGYPITEPYWARVKIAGQANTPVLIQLYQRRVLTYVPSAAAGFKVQVNNIGRHYYAWRYNFAGKPAATPTAAPKTAPTPVPTLGPTGLTVFAAASLQDAFKEAGTNFKQANPNVTGVQFNFQGSQALVAQLQQGAPADLFASADKANMDKAVAAGVIDGAPKELLRNVLTVVLPDDNPANIKSLKDLAKPGVKISLADPSVPVGNYSVQVLDKLSADAAYGANFKQQVLDNVVTHEDNVKAVLTRVQLDQVDAGIVYVTDALAANKAASGNIKPVRTLEIPVNFNVVAIYYIAQVKDAAHPQAAQAFLSYILSAEGQGLLGKYGFIKAGGQ
jgi:molybdate transport system substrate-binding protein